MAAFFIIGAVFLIAAIVLFFIQKNQKSRAYNIRVARSATASELKQMAQSIAQEIGGGNWREYVKVSGTIECDRPLTSELKQETCVYYYMSVAREYEETVTKTDSEGKSYQETERRSETISSNKQSVPFELVDSTGNVTVDPEGASVEGVKVLDEFRQEQATGGILSFGRFSLAIGSGGQRTLGYRYTETILPLKRRVFILGMANDSTGELAIRKPIDADKKFIISLKTEEELLKAADRGAKILFYIMLGCLAVGLLLILIGLFAG